MVHIYQNRGASVRQVVLLTADKSSSSVISMGPGSKITLTYPGLDRYVPHILTKITADGVDLSPALVAARVLEEKEQLKAKRKPADKLPEAPRSTAEDPASDSSASEKKSKKSSKSE